MARSNVDSYGLLDSWARVMHEDFFRFNQIDGDGVTMLPGCSGVYIQYERDYIATAIRQAVAHAAEYLQFYPLPAWVSERIELASDTDWDDQRLTTRYGWVQGFGIRQTELIHSAKAVTYSDASGDGVEDTGSITIDAVFPIEETRVFFRTADGAKAAADALWEIHELTFVDNEDGTYTASGHKGLFADPTDVWAKEYRSTDFRTKFAGDTGVAGDFVTAVDVYRVYPDPSEQADHSAAVTLVAADGTEKIMQAQLTNAQNGTFRLAVLAGDDDPDSSVKWIAVDVSYLAGYPLENNRMSAVFESGILRYANTLFPQQPSGFCDRTRAMWERDLEVLDTQLRDDTNPLQYPFTMAATDLWATIKTFKTKQIGPPGNRPRSMFLGV